MNWLFSRQRDLEIGIASRIRLRCRAGASYSALLFGLLAIPAAAQVVTIDNSGKAVSGTPGQGATVDRRYAQIEPTHISLQPNELDPKTRIELMRFLQSDQGFAMRPFPRGHHGLTLVANGKLEPAGESYLSMVTSNGMSAKPGDRLVITDVKIDKSKIVFDLNGGPDAKHRFLRHIQIGAGPELNPVTQDNNEQEPTGARLTLSFKERIPELTGKDVEALLAPLISFAVKTPIQAFTDTLPPKLKTAILDHNVLVGMSTDMVLFAKGQPQSKVREMDGQMPFEEWIYGKSPSDIEFVRINGNRVIRVEIAKVGKAPQIFTQDEVEGMMRTDGTPIAPETASGARTIQLGDVERDPDKQAPAAPPSLRNPGETLPADDPKNNRGGGVMKPVQFPKQQPDDEPNARPSQQPDATQTSSPAQGSSSTTAQPVAQPAAATPAAPATVPASTSTTPPQ
ncbi:MAG TPA: hypothetical protein VHZ28_06750 [Terracidiphilus sp.]|jgi:hypothetical protein|nr:hypothetical protein [Terracidiphilus sp.]